MTGSHVLLVGALALGVLAQNELLLHADREALFEATELTEATRVDVDLAAAIEQALAALQRRRSSHACSGDVMSCRQRESVHTLSLSALRRKNALHDSHVTASKLQPRARSPHTKHNSFSSRVRLQVRPFEIQCSPKYKFAQKDDEVILTPTASVFVSRPMRH